MKNAFRTVGVRELKTHTSALLRSVQEEGVEIIITVHGRPVARLEPLGTPRGKAVDGMGGARGIFAGTLPQAEWEDFQALKRQWDPRLSDGE
ncbi:MAG: type II toxin-antitoxin system prevent-host-death family antitoxin [Dehalococcoidia bacterium]|nr:type II toxin-antitoxin system prevent-host-death family antitoxin [Dehalococcoidia bacterium]